MRHQTAVQQLRLPETNRKSGLERVIFEGSYFFDSDVFLVFFWVVAGYSGIIIVFFLDLRKSVTNLDFQVASFFSLQN